jgi:F-type H+-transporting ATPase subunit delta
LEKFIKLSSTKKGKIDALLVSSKELSQDERKKINEEISNSIKSNVDFTYKIDKNLVSGIKIQVGSLLIDTSVSNRLKRIKQSMIEN